MNFKIRKPKGYVSPWSRELREKKEHEKQVKLISGAMISAAFHGILFVDGKSIEP